MGVRIRMIDWFNLDSEIRKFSLGEDKKCCFAQDLSPTSTLCSKTGHGYKLSINMNHFGLSIDPCHSMNF